MVNPLRKITKDKSELKNIIFPYSNCKIMKYYLDKNSKYFS